MDLVRYIYQFCRWKHNLSYRIPGTVLLEYNIVNFDLTKALEIHEGRLTEPI